MSTFPVEFRTTEVNKTSLAYADRGEGQAVVFVHGSSQDMRTWVQQLNAFASEHRAIIYSRRYARPNEEIPAGQDDQMEPHVEDLVALLRNLDAVPAHLVGNSWGAFICLLAAIKEPTMVRSIVLCETPVLPLFISNEPKPGEIAKLFLTRPVDGFRIARFGIGVVEPTVKAYRAGDIQKGARIFGTALLGKEGLEAMPEERKRMLEENEAAEVAQFLGAGFPPLPSADVGGVQTPALLLAGERSPALFRKTLAGELERLLPNAQRAEIPEAWHMMHEDNPDAFNKTVLEFLSRAAN